MHIIDEQTGTPQDEYQTGNGQEKRDDYSSLFTAPELSTFVKAPKTATAREYEQRVKALLKAGMVGAINTQNLPDAAAFIYHGPGVASAAGQLADADERAKKIIDFLTTPANPYAMFLVTALPFVSQLFRNHETQLQAAPEVFRTRKERRAQRRQEQENQPKVTLHLPFGKSLKLGFRARFPVGRIFAGFRAQTVTPEDLTVKVFSDPKVISELRKQGVVFKTPGDG